MGSGQFKLQSLIRQLADGKCDQRGIISFDLASRSRKGEVL